MNGSASERGGQEESLSGSKLPLLPYEIWFAILEMAIRPDLIVDLNFGPSQIEQAFLSLRTPAYGGERAAKELVQQRVTVLKAVCRTWMEIIEVLNRDSKQWVLNRRYTNPKPPTDDTNKCSRLNLEYLNKTTSIMLGQSHPVSMISMIASSYSTQPTYVAVNSVFDIASFPDQLRVLHLRFKDCTGGGQLLRELETKAVPLTTLSLILNFSSLHLIRKDLKITTLTTLFLALPRYNQEQRLEPSSVQWIFPRLCHLSLTEEGSENHGTTPRPTHPFLLQLLRAHFDEIQALRVHPMTAEFSDESSSLYWAKAPKLLALSTDFYWLTQIKSPKHFLADTPSTKSTSLQHLIQIDMDFRNPNEIAKGIQIGIGACPHLKSVSLVGPPFRYEKPNESPTFLGQPVHNWWEVGAMDQLYKTCKDRRIELLDQERQRFVKGS
jgi:hypothetical protein